VIPGAVLVSLDVRAARDSIREAAVAELFNQASLIATSCGCTLEAKAHLHQPAVPMDEELTALLTESIEFAGYASKRIPSGAGHDAMMMATRVPAAMLFVRSPGGISHHPSEAVLEEDVAAALGAGHVFLRRFTTRQMR
jgi:allantoate deiminase